MRILSVGRPLAHQSIDNYSVFAAPAFSDYEVIAVDPGGLFDAVADAVEGRGNHHTYAGMPVVNGPTRGDAVGIADVLRRRLDETTRLLERGGVVVVFGYPQVTLPTVLGFTGADRYCFLPAPPGIAWGPPLLGWAEGATVAVTDHAHPFAPFIDAIRSDTRYRAVFEERAPGFAASATVFARTGGGQPVGVEFSVLGGRVVFLPAPGPNAGVLEQGQTIEAATRELLARPDQDDQPPYWLNEIEVPGLAPLIATAETAADLVTRAEERSAAADRETRDLLLVRDVLWREGTYGLTPSVLRCLELLNFYVVGDERHPEARASEGSLLVEAEGSADAVGMAPHYRVRARLDAAIAAGQDARGLVVVNGQRTLAPDRRSETYLDALRIGAEATRYALLPAPELFAAARAALAGLDTAVLAQIRRRLVETDGPVTLTDLLPAD